MDNIVLSHDIDTTPSEPRGAKYAKLTLSAVENVKDGASCKTPEFEVREACLRALATADGVPGGEIPAMFGMAAALMRTK